jgi:hypothetical protein
MFVFNSIKELIETLYKERELIDFLFNKREKSISYENLLNYLEDNQEKIQNLLEKSILSQTGNSIELDSRIKDFFENFADTTKEINIEYTDYLIKSLNERLFLFENENKQSKKDDYARKIKSSIREIAKNIIKNINIIRNNIEDVYATEKNFKIKLYLLNNFDSKRIALDKLIDEIEHLQRENQQWQFYIKTGADDELFKSIIILRHTINISRRNLIDIQQKILEYLNQIKIQSQLNEKIQKIKALKDKLLLKEMTNFEDIIKSDSSYVFQPTQTFFTKLSIPFLQDENSLPILLKVSYKHLRGKLIKGGEITDEIEEQLLTISERQRYIINLERFKQNFVSTGGNLIDFVLDYDFENQLEFKDKITLFCKVATTYNNEFIITDEYQEYENIEFAVIKPKKL